MHQLQQEISGEDVSSRESRGDLRVHEDHHARRVIRSLETLTPQITVPAEIARKAKRAIDRMLELA